MPSLHDIYDSHRRSFAEKYPSWERWFLEKPSRVKALSLFKTLSTVVMYAAYIGVLSFFGITRDPMLIKALLVPAAIFLIVTAVRSGINAPRPYELFDIKPLLPKSTKGKSCPSRHSACAFAIAIACTYVSIPFGVVMFVLAAVIAASRPIMGVHFPADVAFGLIIAAAIGALGEVIF